LNHEEHEVHEEKKYSSRLLAHPSGELLQEINPLIFFVFFVTFVVN